MWPRTFYSWPSPEEVVSALLIGDYRACVISGYLRRYWDRIRCHMSMPVRIEWTYDGNGARDAVRVIDISGTHVDITHTMIDDDQPPSWLPTDSRVVGRAMVAIQPRRRS